MPDWPVGDGATEPLEEDAIEPPAELLEEDDEVAEVVDGFVLDVVCVVVDCLVAEVVVGEGTGAAEVVGVGAADVEVVDAGAGAPALSFQSQDMPNRPTSIELKY